MHPFVPQALINPIEIIFLLQLNRTNRSRLVDGLLRKVMLLTFAANHHLIERCALDGYAFSKKKFFSKSDENIVFPRLNQNSIDFCRLRSRFMFHPITVDMQRYFLRISTRVQTTSGNWKEFSGSLSLCALLASTLAKESENEGSSRWLCHVASHDLACDLVTAS